METDLSCDRADVDLKAISDAAHAGHCLIPVGLDLLALARWASMLVNAALMLHQAPGDLGAKVRLVNLAMVLQRMLSMVRVPVEGRAGQKEGKGRGKGPAAGRA